MSITQWVFKSMKRVELSVNLNLHFSNVFEFSEYRPYMPFKKNLFLSIWLSKYCCKWHFFQIKVLNSLLLIYKNMIDFYMLTLYFVTLQNSLINSSNCFCIFLNIFCVNSHAICKSFISSFPTFMRLIFFTCLLYG